MRSEKRKPSAAMTSLIIGRGRTGSDKKGFPRLSGEPRNLGKTLLAGPIVCCGCVWADMEIALDDAADVGVEVGDIRIGAKSGVMVTRCPAAIKQSKTKSSPGSKIHR